MKLPSSPRCHRQGGFLVIALFAIIATMLIYIAANLHVLAALKRDLRIVEQKQVQRLNKSFPVAVPATNSVPLTPPNP